MKLLFSSKMILAFVSTFIMIVSNIKPIPVFAEEEVATNAAVAKVEWCNVDFQGTSNNPNNYVTSSGKNATVSVKENNGNKYLNFMCGTDGTPTKRSSKMLGSLANKDGFVIELRVQTPGEQQKARVGLSSSTSWGDVLWTGTTSGEWSQVRIVCTVNTDGSITSQASVKSGDTYVRDGEPYELTNVSSETETAYLCLGVCDVKENSNICFDDIKVYYTKNYTTLQDANNSGDAVDTIEVVGNAELTADVISKANITIDSGVTLDLNGFTLDMDNNYLYSEGNVVDSSNDKSGRLKVAAENGKLAENNSQMPVYIAEDEVYMLATMKKQWLTPIIETDYFTSVSRPSFGEPHYEKLQSGASAARLQFILRLDWTKDETDYYQEFSYSDALVQNVYTNGKAFSVTVNGLTDYASSMKVSEYVKSDLGVVLKNNSFSMNTTSGK